MSVTLYAAVVPTYLQMLGSVAGLIGKAEAHCAGTGTLPAAILDARLADDMLPFAYQVKSVAAHSIGAIEGVRRGEFNPDRTTPPDSFAGLAKRIAEAQVQLAAIDPAEIDGFAGKPVDFAAGDFRVPFVAEDFLLSFAQPNFYFHVTTTYAILRSRGVAIGKRDFLGAPRTRVPA